VLTVEQLEELRRFDSPTVCNALERFKLRPRSEGFLPPSIRSLLPYDKPFIGYASTAKFSTAAPAEKPLSLDGYYRTSRPPPGEHLRHPGYRSGVGRRSLGGSQRQHPHGLGRRRDGNERRGAGTRRKCTPSGSATSPRT
jgi:hypothetical protein